MARKKHPACPDIDSERLLRDVQSPDETVRGKAVCSLCPCHAGWAAFERHVSLVLKAIRDRSRPVRAQALHVFHDAARMRLKDELDDRLQEAEARVRGKRPSRFRPGERALTARRGDKIRWHEARLRREPS